MQARAAATGNEAIANAKNVELANREEITFNRLGSAASKKTSKTKPHYTTHMKAFMELSGICVPSTNRSRI